jgi:hypothetical protein
MVSSQKIILGLPKGSLQDSTFAMMKKAGFNVSAGSRSYMPSVDDPEIQARLIRAQEISRYVEQGLLDAGLTGFDWIQENQSDVHEVANLVYAKQGLRPVRWVLAVPNDSTIQTVQDLQGKRIATEAVGHDPSIPGAQRRAGRSRVLVGRDRGQGAGTGGCHRGDHGNGILAAGQQPAHRGNDPGVHHPPDREQKGVGRSAGSARKSNSSRCCCAAHWRRRRRFC